MKKSRVISLVIGLLLVFGVLLPLSPLIEVPHIEATADMAYTLLASTTTTNGGALPRLEYRGGVFHGQGYMWVVYTEREGAGTTWAMCASTTNGTVHVANNMTTLSGGEDMTYMAGFASYSNGTHVFFSYSEGSSNLYFHMAALNVDGTLTFVGSRATVDSGVCSQPHITEDSTGGIWIAHRNWVTGHRPTVSHTHSTDGGFVHEPGSPWELSAVQSNDWDPAIFPLADGKVYVLMNRPYGDMAGRLWNGTGWEDWDTDLDGAEGPGMAHLTGKRFVDGEMFIVWGGDSSSPWWRKYNSSMMWEAGVEIDSVNDWDGHGPTYNEETGEIYILGADDPVNNKIFYWYYNGSTWSFNNDYIDESGAAGIENSYNVQSSQYVEGSVAGISWIGNTESPWQVRFAYMEFNQDPVNDACDSDATFDVVVDGWVNVTVTDADGGYDKLTTVDMKVTTASAETFTLRWTKSTDAFTETVDASGVCTIDASDSTRTNIDLDTDVYSFNFKINAAPIKGACSVEVTTTDDGSATDVDTYSSEFSINFYLGITINDGSHSWVSMNPGTTDQLLGDDGDIDVTIDANANFDLEAKGDGALTSGGNTIALSNVEMHETTLGSAIDLTTSYQDIPDLTDETRGVSQAKAFKLWISIPNPQQDGTYTYTLSVKGTEH